MTRQRWLDSLEFVRAEEFHTPNQPLKGRAVSILGGGPSLSGSIVGAVSEYPVICVNNSFMLMKDPSLVVALDTRWYTWHGASLRACGHTSVSALRAEQSPPKIGAHYYMKKERDHDYPFDREHLVGGNSGHAAVTLAIQLGARAVYLIGFDMDFHGEKTHWHSGHRVPASQSNYTVRFRPKLEALQKTAAQNGVKIETITPSAARIPRVSLETAMKDLAYEDRMGNPEASTTLSE